jgi:hypothetical protein
MVAADSTHMADRLDGMEDTSLGSVYDAGELASHHNWCVLAPLERDQLRARQARVDM